MAGMTPAAIRVLLVDDDPMARKGLGLILGGCADIEVVGEAEDGAAAVELVAETQPDVVLMDIRMPVLDGIAATERIVQIENGPRVLVLTTFGTEDLVVQALAAGAGGYLVKDTAPDGIVDAVRRVAAREPILSPSAFASLIDRATQAHEPERRRAARERLDRLTDRELDVAQAIGRGLSNSHIAAELSLSLATVKAHVGRVIAKLEATNRVQVAICVHDARQG
ncbi:MAG: response regulator transcription factor [Marmoricola sp.]